MVNCSLSPAFAALLSDPRVAIRRPGSVTLEQFRVAANAFMARAPLPDVYASEDHTVATKAGELRIRLIQPTRDPKLPLLLFLHGGGFIFGSLDSHEAMARRLALAANAAVAAVDYRLAPEHSFPAAVDDAVSALSWLAERGPLLGLSVRRFALAGDSAGAHLALSLALRPSLPIPLAHLGLFYPMLDPKRRSASARSLAEGFMLTSEFVDWAWESYAIPPDRVEADLLSADLSVLPPTTVVTASHDPLRDEGWEFVDRAGRAGVAVHHECFRGMIHGFAGFPHIVREADLALASMGARIGFSLLP